MIGRSFVAAVVVMACGAPVEAQQLDSAMIELRPLVGAIITHLFIVGGSPLVAILLLASTVTIAFARRSGR